MEDLATNHNRHPRWTAWAMAICGVLFVLSASLTASTGSQPNQIQETHQTNVKFTTTSSYKAQVRPNPLSPNGGWVQSEQAIFPSVTTSVLVHVETRIDAAGPVEINATATPTLHIVASQLWAHDSPLAAPKSISFSGNQGVIYEVDYVINVPSLLGFLKSVEDDLQTAPNGYEVQVSPGISGQVTYAGQQQTLTVPSPLTFTVNSHEWQAEKNPPVIQQTSFATTHSVANSVRLFGTQLPLVPVRLGMGLLSVLLGGATFLLWLRWRGQRSSVMVSESQKVALKYSSRMVDTTAPLHGGSVLTLKSFASLLRVADEQERTIFRYEFSPTHVQYFILDQPFSYVYEAQPVPSPSGEA